MIESDWLTGIDVAAMLEEVRARVSQRKLRLLACAYRRRHWNRLDEAMRRGVELAEGYIEGEVNRTELNAVERDPSPHQWDEDVIRAVRTSLDLTADLVADAEADEASRATGMVFKEAGCPWDTRYYNTLEREYHEEHRIQAMLLREVLGNPFQPVVLDPAWLAWDDAAVVKVARTVYEERRFEEMTVLADALEEAGCTCAALLDHCRQPGEHVRGCWLVDLLLQRV